MGTHQSTTEFDEITGHPGKVGVAGQAFGDVAAQIEVVIAGYGEIVADGVEVVDHRRALGLVADGRALEHVAHIHQQDLFAGRRGLVAHAADVARGAGGSAQRWRELGVHEPRLFGSDVAVEVVGPHEVDAEGGVVLGATLGANVDGNQKQQHQAAQIS